MRKKLVGVLALALAIGVVGAGLASSASAIRVVAGNLILNANGSFTPKRLPKLQYAPIKLIAQGNLRTQDGSHVPPGKTIFFEFDRNGRQFTRGLPSCSRRRVENTPSRVAKRACQAALLGQGKVSVEVKFPDQDAFTAVGPLLMFNGPKFRRKPTIIFHVYVNIPVPTAVVAVGYVNPNAKRGRYGTTVKIPQPLIAGGNGSLTSFRTVVYRKWRLRRRVVSYIYARCFDRRLQARAQLDFLGDSTKLTGTVVKPCQQRPVRRHRRR
jgi:hypothetical protein